MMILFFIWLHYNFAVPLDQVKTLYDNLDGYNENKKLVKGKEIKIKDIEKNKKQQKQPYEKKKDETAYKKKIPKSIEDALDMVKY